MKNKSKKLGLTTKEAKVLRYSAKLWNLYMKMGEGHPDEHDELRLYIHKIQYLISRRVARRVNPEIWR